MCRKVLRSVFADVKGHPFAVWLRPGDLSPKSSETALRWSETKDDPSSNSNELISSTRCVPLAYISRVVATMHLARMAYLSTCSQKRSETSAGITVRSPWLEVATEAHILVGCFSGRTASTGLPRHRLTYRRHLRPFAFFSVEPLLEDVGVLPLEGIREGDRRRRERAGREADERGLGIVDPGAMRSGRCSVFLQAVGWSAGSKARWLESCLAEPTTVSPNGVQHPTLPIGLRLQTCARNRKRFVFVNAKWDKHATSSTSLARQMAFGVGTFLAGSSFDEMVTWFFGKGISSTRSQPYTQP